MVTYLDRQIGRVVDGLDSLGLSDSTRIIYTSDHGEDLGARGLFGKFTMYEESAAIPMMMAGPDIPRGKRVSTPVSLVDFYPTVADFFNLPSPGDLPGQNLFNIIDTEDPDRSVLSEYHAVGSSHAIFMLRHRRYKYVHYEGAVPQLFDLEEDPKEVDDLAGNPEYEQILKDLDRRLRRMVDPAEADARARADQQSRIEEMGGRDALIRRGAFDNSPVPGEEPKFHL
jgi:choline-sulfatase